MSAGDPNDTLDLFAYVPLFGPRSGLPSKSTLALWWFPPLVAVLVVVATLVEGGFGSVADFQLRADAKRVVHGITDPSRVSWSEPYFPLVRDAGSWYLAFTIVVGTLLLHRQWRLIARALPAMRRSGAIVPRDEPLRLGGFTRLVGIDRKLYVDRGAGNRKLCEPAEALDRFVAAMSNPSQFKRVTTMLVLVILAIVGARALRMGERRGIFSLLAPGSLDKAGQARWQETAYHTWWASEDVFAGGAVYFILAVFAVLLILSFNVGGLLAVYVAVALRFVAHVNADWWNRDGRYGWRPVAEIFQTVRLAVTLLGVTVSVTVLLLGPKHIVWIVWLVVLYLALLPLYTVVPWGVFRRVALTARERRIRALEAEMRERGIIPERDILAASPYLAEIDRCWAARIRPLQLDRLPFSTYAAVWLLPIALTLMQIVYAV